MGGCSSSPLFKEQPLIEGELNAQAMRDPFFKEEPASKADARNCFGCCRDETSCFPMFWFTSLVRHPARPAPNPGVPAHEWRRQPSLTTAESRARRPGRCWRRT